MSRYDRSDAAILSALRPVKQASLSGFVMALMLATLVGAPFAFLPAVLVAAFTSYTLFPCWAVATFLVVGIATGLGMATKR